jgi:hypothetical protein
MVPMLLALLVTAAIVGLATFAVFCVLHGWSSTGFMHGDGGGSFGDGMGFFDAGGSDWGDSGCDGDGGGGCGD